MPPLLTTAASMICPHGGQVISVSSNSRAQAAGAFILRSSDTFTIVGCVFNISGAPHPCTSVQWSAPATHCQAMSDFALTNASVGLCVAADQAPQGAVQIVSVQSVVQGI